MMPKIRGLRSIVLILVVAILAWMVMDFNSRMASLNRVGKVQKIVVAQFQEVKATKAVLETQVAFAASDAAVEKWAYEDGHMVRPGDYPIKPVAGAVVTPTAAPKPAVIQPQVSNSESWFALFLGQ
jgi:hypothetical protein